MTKLSLMKEIRRGSAMTYSREKHQPVIDVLVSNALRAGHDLTRPNGAGQPG